MTPAEEVMDFAWHRWMASGVRGLRFGVERLAARLGLDGSTTCAGVLSKEWCFARIEQLPDDPRRFRLVEAGGTVALLVQVYTGEPGVMGPTDVIALALQGGRFWRLTLSCSFIEPDAVESNPACLRLCQDVHRYMRSTLRVAALDLRAHRVREDARAGAAHVLLAPIWEAAGVDPAGGRVPRDHPLWRDYMQALLLASERAAAAEEQFRRLRPAAMPKGILVVDPVALDWTKRGGLAGVERIEILDAPATGPLGRALRRLNPMIGTARGVELIGAADASAVAA